MFQEDVLVYVQVTAVPNLSLNDIDAYPTILEPHRNTLFSDYKVQDK
jgi:hypothetical protein